MSIDLAKIKRERMSRGLTQEDMADALGWKSRSSYAKRESGSVPIGADELIHIAEVLGYSDKKVGIFFTRTVPEKEH